MDNKVKIIKCPGEADDKCCWCFPIKIGVMIIGIFMILYAISMVVTLFDWLGLGGGWVIWGILYAICAIPIIVGAVFYIRYFMDMENADRKAGTTKACLCVIVSAFLAVIVAILVFIIQEGATFAYI